WAGFDSAWTSAMAAGWKTALPTPEIATSSTTMLNAGAKPSHTMPSAQTSGPMAASERLALPSPHAPNSGCSMELTNDETATSAVVCAMDTPKLAWSDG